MATGSSFTVYMQDLILKWIRKQAAFTMPAAPTTYLALMSGTPGDDGTGATEIVATGYARQAITWGTITDPAGGASGSKIANSVVINFNTSSAYTVNTWAIMDAPTGGNMIGYLPGFSDAVAASDGYQVAVGNLTWLVD